MLKLRLQPVVKGGNFLGCVAVRLELLSCLPGCERVTKGSALFDNDGSYIEAMHGDSRPCTCAPGSTAVVSFFLPARVAA